MPNASAAGGPTPGVNWPSRIAALVALAAVGIALLVVIVGSLGGDDSAGVPTADKPAAGKSDGDGAENPKKYAVESGDSLTSIAERFDVSVKRLQRLNPDVDPQALATGQELKIR